MPVQDGLQSSGTLTATTSAAISQSFGFRARFVQVTASSTGGCFVDLTGAIGLATTSASYPMNASEAVKVTSVRDAGYYTGFSILGTAGITSTVRWIALA